MADTSYDTAEAARLANASLFNITSAEPLPAEQAAENRRLATSSLAGITQDQGPSAVVDGKLLTSTDDTGATVLEEVVVSETFWNQVIAPNPLLDYTTSNYALSLHLLPNIVYNQLAINPEGTYVPQNVIVASAGRYRAERSPAFKEDFFFEDFKMTTYVNTTSRNRSSNLIECSFTIIEPLGFTLINRLIAATKLAGGSNYIKQPYLLEIEFFVGSDEGTTVAAPLVDSSGRRQTKWIPIMFTGIKTRVTNKGTEYQIDAVPYNHQAMSAVMIATPANFKVKAASVKDAFGTGDSASSFVSAFTDLRSTENAIDYYNKAIQDQTITAAEREAISGAIATLRDQAAAKSGVIYENAGLTDLLNAWLADLKLARQINTPHSYKIVVDKEIGEALLYDSKPTTQSAVENTNQAAANKSAAGLNASTLSWQGGVINIPAGTKIDQFIEFIIRNSNYIKDQIKDPLAGDDQINVVTKDPTKPLRWFKIVPSLQVIGYDSSTNQYAYEITYYVRPWTMQTKHPMATNGRVNGWVKEYNYMFTGKNRDVIDCQIDFDMLYYTQLTSIRDQYALATNSVDSTRNAQLKGQVEGQLNTQPTGPIVPCTDPVMPVPIAYTSQNPNLQLLSSRSSVKQASAADLQNSLTLSSRGDMINVKLKIIGDPQLIKQDDIFYGQALSSGQGLSQFTPNGSIFTDDSELYVKLNFLTPTDYDDTLGLPVSGSYDYSLFSGTYKIITVENQFYKGKFEQTLDLVRVPQTTDCQAYAVGTTGAYVSALLGQLPTTTTSTRFAGPAILVNNLASGGGLSLSGFAGQLEQLVLGKVQTEIAKAVSGLVDGLVTNIDNLFAPGAVPGTGLITGDFVDLSPGTTDFNFTSIGGEGLTFTTGADLGTSLNLTDGVDFGGLGL